MEFSHYTYIKEIAERGRCQTLPSDRILKKKTRMQCRHVCFEVRSWLEPFVVVINALPLLHQYPCNLHVQFINQLIITSNSFSK